MKNRNLVIVILAVICAGLLAGVVYTVTKGKSGTQKNRRHRQKRVQTKRNHSPESSEKTERNTNRH